MEYFQHANFLKELKQYLTAAGSNRSGMLHELEKTLSSMGFMAAARGFLSAILCARIRGDFQTISGYKPLLQSDCWAWRQYHGRPRVS